MTRPDPRRLATAARSAIVANLAAIPAAIVVGLGAALVAVTLWGLVALSNTTDAEARSAGYSTGVWLRETGSVWAFALLMGGLMAYASHLAAREIAALARSVSRSVRAWLDPMPDYVVDQLGQVDDREGS